jgi:hypothetical protein
MKLKSQVPPCQGADLASLIDRFLHRKLTEAQFRKKADALLKKLRETCNDDHEPGTVAAAKQLYDDEGRIEIDANAIVSRGDDNGAYVSAWVWVKDTE